MTKIKADDPMFQTVLDTIQHIKDAAVIVTAGSEALSRAVRDHELSVDARKLENTKLMEAHINDPNLRPTFKYTLNKERGDYVVVINDQTYMLGKRPDFLELDEDENPFFWTDPELRTFYAKTRLDALFSIFNHFCTKRTE